MSVALAQSFQDQIKSLNSLNLVLMLLSIGMFLIWFLFNRRKKISNKKKYHLDALNINRIITIRDLSMNELLEIEDSLLAVKELYVSKLITAEVYIHESMKYARKLQA